MYSKSLISACAALPLTFGSASQAGPVNFVTNANFDFSSDTPTNPFSIGSVGVAALGGVARRRRKA